MQVENDAIIAGLRSDLSKAAEGLVSACAELPPLATICNRADYSTNIFKKQFKHTLLSQKSTLIL